MINIFNQTNYECVDFAKSDYERKEQYELSIQQIKNGTYWLVYNKTYAEIISLKCNCNYLSTYELLLFLFFFLY